MISLVSITSYKLVNWEFYNIKLQVLPLGLVGFKTLYVETRSGNIMLEMSFYDQSLLIIIFLVKKKLELQF
jgi:hypothetical protein